MENKMKDLRQLFGTDGIRGIANIDLTPEFVLKVGRAGAKFLSYRKKVKNNKRSKIKSKILVGRDTRPSGDFISKYQELYLVSLCKTGLNIFTSFDSTELFCCRIFLS